VHDVIASLNIGDHDVTPVSAQTMDVALRGQVPAIRRQFMTGCHAQ
jgi:hypothetical protein